MAWRGQHFSEVVLLSANEFRADCGTTAIFLETVFYFYRKEAPRVSLEKYLDKIDACQLINFSAFRKYLPENIRSEVHSHFKVLAETPSLCL